MVRAYYKFGLAVITFGMLFGGFAGSVKAATTVTTFTTGPVSVGQYQKYEATFSISRTFPVMPDFAYPDLYDQAKQSMLPYYYYDAADNPTNFPNRNSPYGVDGITINADITSPSGKHLVQPAFYFQQYSRNGDTMTPGNTFSWKMRFAPEEIGTYTYTISIQDKSGISTYPTSGNLTFQSAGSASNGFVRVSTVDSRYFEFTNGVSFIPLSHGGQWYKNPQSARVTGFESAFATWKTSGINFMRLWDQNDGYSLTTEGHFDGYQSTTGNWWDNRNPKDNYDAGRGEKYNPANLAKGTQINQRGAFEQDLIFASAEQNNVYIQLCSHEDPYWLWDHDIHTAGNKLSDTEHVNYWKRQYRYRVARWGYSTSLFGWEAWNEHYPAGSDTNQQDYYGFYKQWASYVKQTDPYRHMVTTSLGSQSNYPKLWSDSTIGLDYGNYHDYLRTNYGSLRNDEAAFVYRFAWCLGNNLCSGLGLTDMSTWTGPKKPWVWGEIDVANADTSQEWTQPDPKVIDGEGRVRMLHNTTWAGLFSPMGVSPLDWYWDRQTQAQTNTDRLADRKATANFFAGVDFAHANFTYLMTSGDAPAGYTGETIGSNNTTARVYGLRRQDKKAAYLWVQNRNYTWANSPSVASPITPTVNIGNLLNEQYRVEVWSTHTTVNQILVTQTLTPVNGTVSVTLPAISSDVAIKFVSLNVSASPTVTPVPTVAAKPGDANGDRKVDGIDYVIWLNHYNLTTTLGSRDGDFNTDGKVDGIDYVVWLNNYGF